MRCKGPFEQCGGDKDLYTTAATMLLLTTEVLCRLSGGSCYPALQGQQTAIVRRQAIASGTACCVGASENCTAPRIPSVTFDTVFSRSIPVPHRSCQCCWKSGMVIEQVLPWKGSLQIELSHVPTCSEKRSQTLAPIKPIASFDPSA